MTDHLTYLVLGLGGGAVIGALAVGVVITHRASNVINFGHAAIGMYLAFAYYEFRRSGELVLPILGLPERVALLDRPTVASALVIVVLLGAAVGATCFLLIFRPLRQAPALARVVASLGLMVYLIGIVDLRFEGPAATSLQLEGPLSTRLVDAFGIQVPADRYVLAALTVGVIAVLWLVDRFTRFGLATRATAENERGAVVLGLSPTAIGLANWILASVSAGLAIIAAAPLSGLDPAGTSLLIVPALGAALLGGFRSIAVAGLAGIGIGMLQSEILNLQASSSWLPEIGLQQGLPFLIVVVALVVQGKHLPDRSAVVTSRLPQAPEPRWTMAVTGLVVVAAAVALLTLDSSYRLGIIVSAIATVVALSVVVLTGLVGQISLATYALAGTAGFAMVRAGDSLGLGFPLAPLVGIVVAVGFGILAGLPAVRVRGLTLAVTTLAASIAIEELLFRWSWFSGGAEGARVPEPTVLGIDLGIAAPGDAYPRVAFGLLVLAAMALAMALVVNLRRGATGRQWLAVRANERAAEAAGVPVARVKLGATAVAAALAGLAGVLLAYQSQVVSAGSFGAIESLVAVAMAYLAGIATPVAALLAGVLTAGGLLTVVLDELSEGSSKYQFALNGLLLMVIAVRFPAGLIGSAGRRRRRGSGGLAVRAGTGARSRGDVNPDDRELLRREAIVARAIQIVDEGGPDALSLRSLARDLGVSAPALYDHIRSKDELLRLVAGEGYDELASRWGALDPADAEAWIRASSHAYVAFALERPGLFALMFRFRPTFVEGPGEVEDPAATAVFAEALVVVERASAEGVLGGSPPLELALGLWAAVHGVATVLSMSPEMTKELWLVDLVIDGLLAGWKEPR